MSGAVCAQFVSSSTPLVCNAARQGCSKPASRTLPGHRLRLGSVFPRGRCDLSKVLLTKSQTGFARQKDGRGLHSGLVKASHQKEEYQAKRAPEVTSDEDSPLTPPSAHNIWRSMQHRVVVPMVAAGVAVTMLGGAVPSATAADALKTCQCLLQNCA